MARKNIYKRKYPKCYNIVFESYNCFASDFIENMERQKYSRATILSYVSSLSNFYYFLDAKKIKGLQEMSSDLLEKYRLEQLKKKYSDGTSYILMRSLKHFFRYLEEEGKIFINPTANMILPRPKTIMQYVPTIKEIKRFLSAPDIRTKLGIRDRALLELTYSSGMRIGELIKLDIFSINLHSGAVRVCGKGQKERVIPVGKHSCYWLKKYLSEVRDVLLKDNIDIKGLWINRSGQELGKEAVDMIFLKYSTRANLKRISPHAVRRACVTHMLRNGAHPVQIQMLLGHATLGTLNSYLKMTIVDLKKTHSKSNPGH